MSTWAGAALVNGGLYLVRWTGRPDSPDSLALFATNRDECDADETPTEKWEFFGDGLDCYQISQYDVITRLDVVPVDWLNAEARTWLE